MAIWNKEETISLNVLINISLLQFILSVCVPRPQYLLAPVKNISWQVKVKFENVLKNENIFVSNHGKLVFTPATWLVLCISNNFSIVISWCVVLAHLVSGDWRLLLLKYFWLKYFLAHHWLEWGRPGMRMLRRQAPWSVNSWKTLLFLPASLQKLNVPGFCEGPGHCRK